MSTKPAQEPGEEKTYVGQLLNKARKAMKEIEDYGQERIDRLCQAVGWAVAEEKRYKLLSKLSIEESGIGDYKTRVSKRYKIYGVLRDMVGVKSIGIIDQMPEKGITKYAKPVGVIAVIVPATNPALTPAVMALYGLKCKDAMIMSPHPRTKKTTSETNRLMREALKAEGAPVDLLQSISNPTVAAANELMRQSDLVMATGGQNLVRAAYSSGTPAYGVGAGNALIIVDETADIEEAAAKIQMSKTNDNGSGCSADSCLIIEETIYKKLLENLRKEGGYLATPSEKSLLQSVLWDADGRRTLSTVAVPATKIAELAGFSMPGDRTFIMVEEQGVGPEYPFSGEKLCPVLALYRYREFEKAIRLVQDILDAGSVGHSCGIYSFNEKRIDQLASTAKVSRMMVRQAQSLSNAGSFTNGMPMTSSLGCGTWGGNITTENISLKHYMNVTWVSRPIPEDRPSEDVLFGEFAGT